MRPVAVVVAVVVVVAAVVVVAVVVVAAVMLHQPGKSSMRTSTVLLNLC